MKFSPIEKIPASDRHAFPLEKINGRLPQLRLADIVLVRHKHGITRRLLRRVTKSYWDHAALVIFSRNPEKGYSADIIIEAIQYGLMTSLRRGFEIHRLEKYLKDPDLYDVGIKRFAWLPQEMQNRVRAFVLMNVDTPYYPQSTIKFFFAWISRTYRRIFMRRQRYSCSGMVQKAFYEAADWGERSKVIFRNMGYTPIQLQDITSPADIAQSDACTWVWNPHD
jgi:hypothetical protein